MLCRIAALDDRGRVAERSMVRALGWQPGQRLAIRAGTQVITITADPAGVFTLARRGHIPLPVAARRWCFLAPGDRVLLAAAPQQAVLRLYTMAALEAMISGFGTSQAGGDAA